MKALVLAWVSDPSGLASALQLPAFAWLAYRLEVVNARLRAHLKEGANNDWGQ